MRNRNTIGDTEISHRHPSTSSYRETRIPVVSQPRDNPGVIVGQIPGVTIISRRLTRHRIIRPKIIHRRIIHPGIIHPKIIHLRIIQPRDTRLQIMGLIPMAVAQALAGPGIIEVQTLVHGVTAEAAIRLATEIRVTGLTPIKARCREIGMTC